jgi:hypothetical protein
MQDELDNVTTILYLLIETTRHDLEGLAATQKELGWSTTCVEYFMLTRLLASLNPSLEDYLLTATAKLRWDDANELPQTRVSFIQETSLAEFDVTRYSFYSGKPYCSSSVAWQRSRKPNKQRANGLLRKIHTI